MREYVIVCLLAVALSSLIATRAVAGYPIEVIDLQASTLEDILPVLQPLMGADETLTGRGSQLIIKAPPERVEEIRRLLGQIDRAPRRLLVTVSNQGELSRGVRERSLSADVSSGDGRITVNPESRSADRASAGAGVRHDDSRVRIHARDVRSTTVETSGQRLQVMEGRPAYISSGVLAPVSGPAGYGVNGAPYPRGGYPYQYQPITRGFYVVPRVSGDMVTLEILQHDDRPGRAGRAFRTQSTGTVVRGRLGEWIDLGGIDQTRSRTRAGTGQSSSRWSDSTRQISVKVECLDCQPKR